MDWLGETVAGLVACLGFVLVGLLLLSASSTHRQTLKFQFRLMITALVLRFIASLVIYQVGLGKLLGEDDAVGWLYGSQLREVWVGNKLGLIDLPRIWKGAFAPGNETLGMSPHLTTSDLAMRDPQVWLPRLAAEVARRWAENQ